MSNIDAIIARSRQPGEFSERQSFTVSRDRAIRKMREFALADPYYYVLELIQAAIASRATHVDMRIDSNTFILSYVGGGFRKPELSQIFDFLFASKAEVETGAIRQLALGINALMRFEPEQIIIESGDGTLAGTTRVEINQRTNMVDVGTPEAALNGTFLRAQGMQRAKVRGQSTLKPTLYGPEETAAIEARCLAAPVPIIVNSHSVFGFASIRTPNLGGYTQVIKFDEGDLYGSIGLARREHNQVFRLLTWGVWVESVEFPLVEGHGFGGIITFNELNKTADHAAIVKDQRYQELWARVRVYADMALSDDPRAQIFEVGQLGGRALSQPELRTLIDTSSLLVAVDPEDVAKPAHFERAQTIGELLDVPVLTVSKEHFEIFDNLVGDYAQVLRPELRHSADLSLLSGAPAEPPARPWILGVRDDIAPLSAPALGQLLRADADPLAPRSKPYKRALYQYFSDPATADEIGRSMAETFLAHLGGKRRAYTCKLYTPQQLPEVPGADARTATYIWARIHVANRIMWEGPVDSPYVGHLLDIFAPLKSPGYLFTQDPFKESRTLAESIANALVEHAHAQLEDANLQALERIQQHPILPGTSAAHIALAALARDSIIRIQAPAQAGQPAAIRFDVGGGAAGARDLANCPLFETLDGRTMSLRDLEAWMTHTGGLVYGTIPQVPAHLDGLDQSRILALDVPSETLLTQIIGQGAYIRVDSRDILAQSGDGNWQIRDLASGLRAYPDAPLLLDGKGARTGALPDEALIEELVHALRLTLSNGLSAAHPEEAAEARRQAARHLRYFVCRRRATQPDMPTYGVEQLGLFLDEELRHVSLEQICEKFRRDETLVMLDGRAADDPQVMRRPTPGHLPRALMLNPWSFQLLKPLGDLVGAFDQVPELPELPELTQGDWHEGATLLVQQKLDSPRLTGQIGLPRVALDAPFIQVISADRQRVSLLRQSSIAFGVVGMVKLKEATDHWETEVRAADLELREESLKLLHSVLDQLPQLQKSGSIAQIRQLVLGFAARHLHLTPTDEGRIRPSFVGNAAERMLATRILNTPFFATRQGVPVGAISLIQQACLERYRAEKFPPASRIELSEDVPEALVSWLERCIERVHTTPPPPGAAARPGPIVAPANHAALAFPGRIENLLHMLRPDITATPGAPENKNLRTRVFAFDFRGEFPEIKSLPWPVSAQLSAQLSTLDKKEPFAYIEAFPPRLFLNQAHPLVKQAQDAPPGDDTPIAWLLLAAYAHINALLDPVTNAHELAFQRRVLDALQAGGLR